MKNIKLVIGLGNPGASYKNAYHSAGLLAIENALKGRRFKNIGNKFSYSKAGNIIFAKSLLFMNESGEAVRRACKYFHAGADETLVAHDDSDIKIGEFKISFGRSSAGHKGVESTIKALGTKNFWRARIGIRPINPMGPISHIDHMKKPRLKAGDFVLKKINSDDRKILFSAFKKITDSLLSAA